MKLSIKFCLHHNESRDKPWQILIRYLGSNIYFHAFKLIKHSKTVFNSYLTIQTSLGWCITEQFHLPPKRECFSKLPSWLNRTRKKHTDKILNQYYSVSNFTSVVHVPCTLGCLVTCLVFNFTTFLPNAFLSLVACRRISSGVIFFTHITRSFLFSEKLERDML